MCLAMPAQIVSLLEDEQAIVNIGGVEKKISLALLENKIQVGDYVIIHVGFALTQLDTDEAEKNLQLFLQLQEAEVK